MNEPRKPGSWPRCGATRRTARRYGANSGTDHGIGPRRDPLDPNRAVHRSAVLHVVSGGWHDAVIGVCRSDQSAHDLRIQRPQFAMYEAAEHGAVEVGGPVDPGALGDRGE